MTELDSILFLVAGIAGFADARISWACIGVVGLLHLVPFLR